MMTRRIFLSFAPIAGLFRLFGGANLLADDEAARREPPENGAWDWWRKLRRTPLARSDDPAVDCLCQAAAFRDDVTILYEGGSEPGGSRRISPLGVFSVEGYAGVYLHAYCHEREAERTFRIERISSIV